MMTRGGRRGNGITTRTRRNIAQTERDSRISQRVERLQRRNVTVETEGVQARRTLDSNSLTDGVSSVSHTASGSGSTRSNSTESLESPRRDIGDEMDDGESQMSSSIERVPKSIQTDNRQLRNSIGASSRERSDVNGRKMNLISVYGKGNTIRRNDNTMRTLAKVMRKVILPQMKFVQGGKLFGSFEYPDFTDDNCWVNALFENIPSMKNASDTMKAEVWMTYRKQIKEQFSLHRSGVTLKMKKNFMDGEYLQ